MVPSNANHSSNTSVSIVVLAFNEAQSLPTTIKFIHKALEGKLSKYEVIIVNDGSRDDTGRVAEGLAKRDYRLKVIHNPKNMGCGYTFMRGVQAATTTLLRLCSLMWSAINLWVPSEHMNRSRTT